MLIQKKETNKKGFGTENLRLYLWINIFQVR